MPYLSLLKVVKFLFEYAKFRSAWRVSIRSAIRQESPFRVLLWLLRAVHQVSSIVGWP